MSRRKGELTASEIDRCWPHQIALREAMSLGPLGFEQTEFCKKNRLLRCDRGPTVLYEDEHYNIHCFATKPAAQAFLDRFGGEWFDPRERGKGANSNKWYKGSEGRRA
jgi:hypothetical protein